MSMMIDSIMIGWPDDAHCGSVVILLHLLTLRERRNRWLLLGGEHNKRADSSTWRELNMRVTSASCVHFVINLPQPVVMIITLSEKLLNNVAESQYFLEQTLLALDTAASKSPATSAVAAIAVAVAASSQQETPFAASHAFSRCSPHWFAQLAPVYGDSALSGSFPTTVPIATDCFVPNHLTTKKFS